MNIDALTNTELFYAALGSVLVVYFFAAAIRRLRENQTANKKRRAS